MQEIIIRINQLSDTIHQLESHLGGNVVEKWGEHILTFNNEYGEGTIRSITFDWGVSLLNYQVCFDKEVKIIKNTKTTQPLQFIYCSEGSIVYHNSQDKQPSVFERYQNVIMAHSDDTEETYIFPENEKIAINFIYILKQEYLKKRNHNISCLNKSLFEVFEQQENIAYSHFGNFNLKIADQIQELEVTHHIGIVHSLFMEGQVHIILALQLLEHRTYEDQLILPESLYKEDLRKIHQLSEYILDNISESMSVRILAKKIGIGPKKLQLGFKLLYGKSVHEYVKQLRLEIARDDIKNTDYTISEIVYQIGFKSRSYFSKIFFERYGLLPTDYRKKQKNLNK